MKKTWVRGMRCISLGHLQGQGGVGWISACPASSRPCINSSPPCVAEGCHTPSETSAGHPGGSFIWWVWEGWPIRPVCSKLRNFEDKGLQVANQESWSGLVELSQRKWCRRHWLEKASSDSDDSSGPLISLENKPFPSICFSLAPWKCVCLCVCVCGGGGQGQYSNKCLLVCSVYHPFCVL